MKKSVLLLVISIFLVLSISGQVVHEYGGQDSENNTYNGQTERYYLNLAMKASNVKTTGILLTSVGFVGMVGGAVIFLSDDNINSSQQQTTGTIIYLSSSILFNVGIPLWIYGGIKRGNNLRAADIVRNNYSTKLEIKPTQYGIGLVCSF